MSPTSITPKSAQSYSIDAPAPPQPVELLQWQDVPTAALEAFAPSSSLPISQYAVRCVMAWAQAQGFAGAIPTWEVGNGTWGVISIANNAALSQVTIPIADMEPFNTSDTAAWGQAVMRWATANQYQMAIPTFLSDGTNVTALAFASGYPGITFYDAPNVQLYQSLNQARLLCNLQDPAVWAQSAMRVAMAEGFFAGWPTWEYTTSRGIMGLSQFDYGALPDATETNVTAVLSVLKSTINAVQISTADALADFAGIFSTFNEAPVADPGLQILTDCLFGALEAGLNAIPAVGGAIAALVSTAVTVAQDAAKAAGGGGPTTLEEYQTMLSDASDATVSYVAGIHDTLLNAANSGNEQTLQAVWVSVYQNPFSNQSMQLGMLALAPYDVVNGETYWIDLERTLTTELNQNLQGAITNQLYTVQRRTYPNRASGKQYWYGTLAEVTGPNGDMAQYVADGDDNWSVWFTDFQVEPGHARGQYVTGTEFWLQASAGSFLPEYAPQDLCQALFTDDGFGDTTGWSGAFSKATVYNNWLMAITEIGLDGQYAQQWSYGTGGNIVTATIYNYVDPANAAAGWTDAYGNVHLNTGNPVVSGANGACGYTQGVIVNYLAPL